MAKPQLKACPGAVKTPPPPLSLTGKTEIERTPSPGQAVRDLVSGQIWALYPLAFLLGRASAGQGAVRFGPVLFAALFSSHLNTRATVVAGIFAAAGLISVLPVNAIVPTFALLILLALFGRPGKKPGLLALRVGAVVAAVHAATLLWYGHPAPYDWIIAAVDALVTPACTLIFSRGLRVLSPVAPVEPIHRRDTWMAVLAMVVAALGGLEAPAVYGVTAQYVAAFWLLAVVCHTGGSGAGASLGVVIGMMAQVCRWSTPLQVQVLAAAGLAGGLFSRRGKLGTVAGCGVGALLLHPELGRPVELITPAAGAGLALILFLATPGSWLKRIGASWPGTQSFIDEQAAAQRRLKDLIVMRLKDLAGVFERLAQTFADAPSPETEVAHNDVNMLLESLTNQVCRSCPSYARCWDELFYETYRELFELVSLAETNGEVGTGQLRGRLSRACIQQYQLVSSVNYLLQVCKVDQYWQKRLGESRELVSSQLKGVASLMDGLAGQLRLDTEFQDEIQGRVEQAVRRLGIANASVMVGAIGNRQLEVRIEKRACGGRSECSRVLAPFLSRLLGQGFTVWQRNCPTEPGERCTSLYCPRQGYEIRHAIRQVAKDGNVFCGDSYGTVQLRDGRLVVILSDGVGSGARAALESRTTVSILQQLLASGLDRDYAIQTVNTVLFLRTPDETFATVDLVAANLFTGETEFLKIGAAPTYIKRGREVTALHSESLPVGILLDRAEPDSTTRTLEDGDTIVMVTDGVLDSLPDDDPSCDWVAQLLSRMEMTNCEQLADYIIQRARQNGRGAARDDMTVAVLQVHACSGRQ